MLFIEIPSVLLTFPVGSKLFFLVLTKRFVTSSVLYSTLSLLCYIIFKLNSFIFTVIVIYCYFIYYSLLLVCFDI